MRARRTAAFASGSVSSGASVTDLSRAAAPGLRVTSAPLLSFQPLKARLRTDTQRGWPRCASTPGGSCSSSPDSRRTPRRPCAVSAVPSFVTGGPRLRGLRVQEQPSHVGPFGRAVSPTQQHLQALLRGPAATRGSAPRKKLPENGCGSLGPAALI